MNSEPPPQFDRYVIALRDLTWGLSYEPLRIPEGTILPATLTASGHGVEIYVGGVFASRYLHDTTSYRFASPLDFLAQSADD